MIATFECSISQHCWAQHVHHPVAMCCDTLCVANRTSAHALAQHCCTNLAKEVNNKETSTKLMLHGKFDHFQV